MPLPSGSALPGYLRKLDKKCGRMEEDLKAKQNDPEVGRFCREWMSKIPRLRRTINRMLKDPDLLHPHVYEQSAQQYSEVYSVFNVLQSFLVPVIYNFNPRSRALTKLVGALGKEVGWPMAPAYVNAGTQLGPATVAQLQGVFLPIYDYREMDGLPAAAHELGHILCGDPRNFSRLIGNWNQQLGQHLQDEEHAPVPLSKTYPQLKQLYTYWMQEFICDMVSTYVTGESFGYAWTQLVTSNGGDIYDPAISHPADESRIRAAALVLEEMGDLAGAQKVRDVWQETVPQNASIQSPEYMRVFPDHLLRGLAKNVVDGCAQIGLVRYDSPQHKSGDMVDLIRQSAQRLVTDPAHDTWERDTMTKLYKRLGITGVGLDDAGGSADQLAA